jgi:diguanylate cyclase (GGDEF)-like protein
VIRWGGDEFLLLLTCTVEEATVKAEELKAAFAHERDASDLPPDIGLSVGVAAVEDNAETLSLAIRVADAAMYRDKLADRRPA